jgi:hypothetical protein
MNIITFYCLTKSRPTISSLYWSLIIKWFKKLKFRNFMINIKKQKKKLKRYILANIIIVLLFFSQSRRIADLKITAIERRRIIVCDFLSCDFLSYILTTLVTNLWIFEFFYGEVDFSLVVNCKTIKCNYVHYFMIISNYLFFDQTISCIKKFKYSSLKWCNIYLTDIWFKRVIRDQNKYFDTNYHFRDWKILSFTI